jgi:4a-hydroxytetrahydrobiopterin dehydratase
MWACYAGNHHLDFHAVLYFKERTIMARTPLSPEAIDAALTGLPGWTRDNDMLSKTYTLPSYTAGLVFASAVGAISERLDHHPEMIIGYKRVTVRFYTHDSGNIITQADVDAAHAVEALGYPKA